MVRGELGISHVVRTIVDDRSIPAHRRDRSETDATIIIVRAVNRASNSSATPLQSVTCDGALQRIFFNKSEITMEVGGWVQVSLGMVFF